MKAVEYYAAAIESGRIPRPVKHEIPKPAPRPKKRPDARLVQPGGKSVPVDRAQCESCWSMRAVETVDGEVVFTQHMVWVKDESSSRRSAPGMSGHRHQAGPCRPQRGDRPQCPAQPLNHHDPVSLDRRERVAWPWRIMQLQNIPGRGQDE
jgi:hypothetical protein